MSDHTNILDHQICLVLNRSWQPIGHRSVRQAVVSLCSENNGEKPAMAMDMVTSTDENGDQVLVYANPVDWETWCTLPIREGDLFITTAHARIRAPLVIIARNFDRMPMKKPRLSSGAIWARDGGQCQYTGDKVTRATGNIDHVVPRDRGGRDTFENMVVARKDINTVKSNRLNSEVGLKLLRKPKAPPAVPVSVTLTEVKHPAWKPFLIS